MEEGWGWLFVAVEHWNAECMGWHICKQGTRFAALEPISQGLMATAGSVAADAGRGLALRLDHGTQYLSDHLQNQLKHWGINPSFAFIEQPQTNGVAERFIRTLKEQVIYERVFQNLQEVREAVRRRRSGVQVPSSPPKISVSLALTPNPHFGAWIDERF